MSKIVYLCTKGSPCCPFIVNTERNQFYFLFSFYNNDDDNNSNKLLGTFNDLIYIFSMLGYTHIEIQRSQQYLHVGSITPLILS